MINNTELVKSKRQRLVRNFWRMDRSAESASRALNVPLGEVAKIYQDMDLGWRETAQRREDIAQGK